MNNLIHLSFLHLFHNLNQDLVSLKNNLLIYKNPNVTYKLNKFIKLLNL